MGDFNARMLHFLVSFFCCAQQNNPNTCKPNISLVMALCCNVTFCAFPPLWIYVYILNGCFVLIHVWRCITNYSRISSVLCTTYIHPIGGTEFLSYLSFARNSCFETKANKQKEKDFCERRIYTRTRLYYLHLGTEVFGNTGFGNNGFSGIMDIFAIPKLKFSIKKVQSNGFTEITDKMAIPNWSVTSENLCIYTTVYSKLQMKQ